MYYSKQSQHFILRIKFSKKCFYVMRHIEIPFLLALKIYTNLNKTTNLSKYEIKNQNTVDYKQFIYIYLITGSLYSVK